MLKRFLLPFFSVVVLNHNALADFCVVGMDPSKTGTSFTVTFEADLKENIFSREEIDTVEGYELLPPNIKAWDVAKVRDDLRGFIVHSRSRNWTTAPKDIVAYRVPFPIAELAPDFTIGKHLSYFNLGINARPYNAFLLASDYFDAPEPHRVVFGAARIVAREASKEDITSYWLGGICVRDADTFFQLDQEFFFERVHFAREELIQFKKKIF